MASSQQQCCVFVGNIPYDATEEQLVQICEEVGPVVSFRLVIDREKGKPKGYGFCEYKDEETALSAIRNLRGHEINGRQLRVDSAVNDKGASSGGRNRELHGGVEGGDSALHQPAGLPLARNGASLMAAVLGGAQSGLQSNGVLPQPPMLGNDPLTLHLAQLSRSQLAQVVSEVKALATHNKDLARLLLVGCPQLPKALFQAQIMLGMVTPQISQPLVHAGRQLHLQSLPMQSQSPLPIITTPNPPSQIGHSRAVSTRPQFLGGILQSVPLMQGGSSVRPVVVVGPSPLLRNQPGIYSGSQLSVPTSSYHVTVPKLPTPQVHTSTPPGGYFCPLQTNKDHTPVNTNSTVLQPSSSGQDDLEQSGPPPKLLKMDDGKVFAWAASANGESKPQSASGVCPPTLAQISHAEPATEGTQLEIPPDAQAVLLQQVLKLTPEQLATLPPEQQQQVFQLQKKMPSGQ